MRIKHAVIGAGVGLALLALAVWAAPGQIASGLESDGTPTSTLAAATDATPSTAVETPEPAATDPPVATASLLPDGAPSADCEHDAEDLDTAEQDTADATLPSADPCNVEQDGENQDGNELNAEDSLGDQLGTDADLQEGDVDNQDVGVGEQHADEALDANAP